MTAFPASIRAVSLDFANTLYPLRSGELEVTIRRLHAFLTQRLNRDIEYTSMREVYLDIRQRQFTENRPTLRENDFTARIAHVVASVTGADPDPAVVADGERAYASGFIDTMIAPPGLASTIAALSKQFDGKVAVCSNFIRAEAIREPLRRDGITPYLAGVVVSCEVGYVKPHAKVFAEVVKLLGVAPEEIVHVGDDWDADIIGATRAGLNAIYTHQWRDEADPAYGVGATALAEIDSLDQLLTLR
ncbi:MAG: HAD family hydrolase [Capsulimonadaceae bacterium]|nr:HAD family hydrolase [Capsulimonadaceae bacterium]